MASRHQTPTATFSSQTACEQLPGDINLKAGPQSDSTMLERSCIHEFLTFLPTCIKSPMLEQSDGCLERGHTLISGKYSHQDQRTEGWELLAG